MIARGDWVSLSGNESLAELISRNEEPARVAALSIPRRQISPEPLAQLLVFFPKQIN